MKKQLDKRGFTLIEVVLVLAIGGLIFLLAFLAFQQASINRRDTQRRSDAGRVVSELENYKGDQGSYPSSSTDAENCETDTGGSFGNFLRSYMCEGSSFESPNGTYSVVAANESPDTNEIRYRQNTNCDGGAGPSVEIGLEKGVVCRDNQ